MTFGRPIAIFIQKQQGDTSSVLTELPSTTRSFSASAVN
jgi:hypothetical protein